MNDDPATDPTALSRSRYETLLDAAATYREVLVVRLLGEVGLRPSELARIRPCDVVQQRADPPRYLLSVPAADGDGVDRTAYVPTRVERELRRYARSNAIGDDEPIFSVTPRRLQMLVTEVATRAAERTGDRTLERVSSNDLREYFARRALVDCDVNPRVVKAVGGWRSFEGLEPYLPEPTADEIVAAFDSLEFEDGSAVDERTDSPPRRADEPDPRALLEDARERLEIARRHRAVTDALLEASTHEEIERAVCEVLVDGGRAPYAFAWIDRRTLPVADNGEGRHVASGITDDGIEAVRAALADDAREIGNRPYRRPQATRRHDHVPEYGAGDEYERDRERPDDEDGGRAAVCTVVRDLTVSRPAADSSSVSVSDSSFASASDDSSGPSPGGSSDSASYSPPSSHTNEPPSESRSGAEAGSFEGAVATVPLVCGDTTYGTLTLGTDREGAFDERERDWLETVGTQIGHAIAAVRRRTLLLSDRLVELEVRCYDERSFFVDASTTLGCRFELDSLVPISESTHLYYLFLEGASPAAVFDLAEHNPGIDDCRLIETYENGWRVEFVVRGSSPMLTLIEYGSTVVEAVVDEGVSRITAECAVDADLRTIVDGLRSAFPDSELVGKREVERSVQTGREFREGLEDRLTDRQEAALRAAYFGGYYDWPRESTAEEIADAMGITSPTLHNHLRKGQHELLRTFFDASSIDDRNGGDA